MSRKQLFEMARRNLAQRSSGRWTPAASSRLRDRGSGLRAFFRAFAPFVLLLPSVLPGAAYSLDCTAPAASDPDARRAELLDAFLESPFAPGPPGGRPTEAPPIVIPGRWQEREHGLGDDLTEKLLLEWFARLGVRPTVTSEFRQDPQEPALRRETRTWTFPGAKVVGDVVGDWSFPGAKGPSDAANVYLRSIEFTSERYPLACGLGVGRPVAKVVEFFGPPRGRSAGESPGRHRYCEAADHCWASEEAAVFDVATFDLDPGSGIVSRVHILYPRRH